MRQLASNGTGRHLGHVTLAMHRPQAPSPNCGYRPGCDADFSVLSACSRACQLWLAPHDPAYYSPFNSRTQLPALSKTFEMLLNYREPMLALRCKTSIPKGIMSYFGQRDRRCRRSHNKPISAKRGMARAASKRRETWKSRANWAFHHTTGV